MGESKDFEEIVKLVRKLRKECPWDRQQTIKTLKEDLLSEADEVRKAIENEDYKNLKEELGDLLWSIVLIGVVAEEKGLFSINDSLKEVKEKIVRRHPHVFGNLKAKTPEDAIRFFKEAKMKEKK
jgi:uncharacterized protein YabN with tetrapyrrole methylase and pyrophosphatase domain